METIGNPRRSAVNKRYLYHFTPALEYANETGVAELRGRNIGFSAAQDGIVAICAVAAIVLSYRFTESTTESITDESTTASTGHPQSRVSIVSGGEPVFEKTHENRL